MDSLPWGKVLKMLKWLSNIKNQMLTSIINLRKFSSVLPKILLNKMSDVLQCRRNVFICPRRANLGKTKTALAFDHKLGIFYHWCSAWKQDSTFLTWLFLWGLENLKYCKQLDSLLNSSRTSTNCFQEVSIFQDANLEEQNGIEHTARSCAVFKPGEGG